ncbi:helix-turn-helix transcriptional regulator [Dysgonomonas sp. Marseille-P4677]|uniref:AraC family transcriptional regulator n=1 Tax=Dysgonomonas sp. Marseille-P4677 TaxID=2364790 RepID=UPI001912F67A|nr:AraC family transcriptional regulator [Dysgonomonas sp. Marseille-P4677]MBK5721819.1 helix-turn-helix transcriptional regulator [Dysgonomonas sp. Marseille-P4677]
MKDKIHNIDNSELAFYSTYNEELGLQFDCVIGNNITHKFPIHIHDSLCIGLINKGKRTIIWTDKSEVINQNEIFVINKNQPHTINQIEPHDYTVITIKGKLDNIDVIFENIVKSEACLILFTQLLHEVKNNRTISLSEKWKKLHRYLIDNHKLSISLTVNETFLRKSLEYIQNNYQQQISVDDIAAHSCMSIYHFCRQFKLLTGLSPHNYLRQYRLNQSYKHLQNNTSVSDTAIETGFYDCSHFIKTFYSYMAVSPKEYQESVTQQ